MTKQKIKVILSLLIVYSILFVDARNITAAEGEAELPQTLPVCQSIKVIRHSDTSLKLSWNPVKDIDGYIIYQYDKAQRTYKAIKSVSAAKNFWIHKKLKRNGVYRYRIATYKDNDGKRIVGSKSMWVTSKLYERNKKKINARAPKVNKKKCYLGLCSEQQLTADVIPAKYGTNKKKRVFSPKIRWLSSNPSVASVSADGYVKAGKKAGKCTVYAVSHNGTRTGVQIEVKNYAKVGGYYNYGPRPEVIELISNYKPHIQQIAEYFSVNRLNKEETLEISINENAEIVTSNKNRDLAPIWKELEELMTDYPYPISIYASSTEIEFNLRDDSYPGYVAFVFDDDCREFIYERIASHWIACWFYPI